MRVDCSTDVGAVRASNQDACDCGTFPDGGAWIVVCDGMGGANGGNVASSVAVKTIRDIISSGFCQGMDPESVKQLMLDAVDLGNEAVFEMARGNEALWGMGTTVALVVVYGGLLHVVHAGDSRAYLKKDNTLEQITMDHSYVQDLVNLGHLTPEQAKVHPQRNIITRVLGVHPDVLPDYSRFDFAPGDMALVCTDGLTGYADEHLILEYMDRYENDGARLVKELIRYAVESGGSDNVTAAVIAG